MIAQFALRLVCGMAGAWCWMPRGEVTCGFFRIQMLVAMAVSVVAAMALGMGSGTETSTTVMGRGAAVALPVLMAVVSYIGSIFWTLARRPSGGLAAAAVLVLSALAVMGLLPRGTFSEAGPAVQFIGSELAAALLLGSAMTAMLLGHWYLTAPMMKLRPLVVLNRGLLAAIVVRMAFAAAGLANLGIGSLSSTQFLWLGMRWVCGLALPLVLALLVPKILRYRNTQSATGVLFALVILVFIGETAAAVLSRDLHWPL